MFPVLCFRGSGTYEDNQLSRMYTVFTYSCLPRLTALSCMRAGMELVGEGLELGAFEDVVVGSRC
jgi:hypothetical protein